MQNPAGRKRHKKGDVVLIVFPFTDLSGEKRRPSLVLGVAEEHLVVAFITTRASGPSRWRVPMAPSEASGIVAPSFIRCDKILSTDVRIVEGAIGEAPASAMRRVDAKVRQLLDL